MKGWGGRWDAEEMKEDDADDTDGKINSMQMTQVACK